MAALLGRANNCFAGCSHALWQNKRLVGLKMVDVPPAKNFIVVVSFLGIYAALLVLMPAGLASADWEGREATYASDYWELPDVEVLATFHNITADNGGAYYSEDWGIDEGFGHNFLFKINIVDDEVKAENQHYYIFIIFPYGHHNMDWIAKANGVNYGGTFYESDFNEVATINDEGDFNVTSAAYTLKCDHVSMHAVVAFNSTAYANCSEAFDNDELTFEFGIEWDELGTGMNAWNLISQILFFQAPDINPLLNAIIAVPLWAAIGYLAYALVMVAISVLPFT